MRRGLLKDLTNTPTQIACGWRLHGDLSRLSNQRRAVVIDLLSGQATVERHAVSPPLEVAEAAHGWVRDRFERDGVPHELVVQATLTLSPRSDSRGDCALRDRHRDHAGNVHEQRQGDVGFRGPASQREPHSLAADRTGR
jgi:hypothetical protein